jgi:hypothetical protein
MAIAGSRSPHSPEPPDAVTIATEQPASKPSLPSSGAALAPDGSEEICAVCGRDAGTSSFCHLYPAGQRIVLCSAVCAERYLHPAKTGNNGYDSDLVVPSPWGTSDPWSNRHRQL